MIPSLSASSSVASKSGDASGSLDSSFNYNGAFQVGGSGSQKQDAGLTAGGPVAGDSILVYVAIGIGAIAILGVVYSVASKR